MKVKVVKKPKDPLALRISIGGNQNHSYFVYRGDLRKCQMLLVQVAEQIVKLRHEPEETPDHHTHE